MHEESHDDTNQTYDEDEAHYNRKSRFGANQQHSRPGSVLHEMDADVNDTYQDIDDDGSDNDQMESRAEYNSEDDEGIE